MCQDDVIILNLYALNSLKYTQQKLIRLQGESISLSKWDYSALGTQFVSQLVNQAHTKITMSVDNLNGT